MTFVRARLLPLSVVALWSYLPPAHAQDPAAPAPATPPVTVPFAAAPPPAPLEAAAPVEPAPPHTAQEPAPVLPTVRVQETSPLSATRADIARATAPGLSASPPTSPQAASAAPALPLTDRVSMGPKGFTAQSEDGRFAFNVRMPFMFDAKATVHEAQPKAGDAFYPRFFGPIFTISLYKVVTGKLIVGFQDKSVTVVNAWADVVAHPLLHLRFGKVLTPIALERQALPLKAVLLEHGIASQLLPISEFGVQLWGATDDKLFEYQLMFGNGGPSNQHYETDVDNGKAGIARAYVRPFARTAIAALSGLGLGFGGSYGRQHGVPTAPVSAASTETEVTRTLGGRTFFSTLVNPTDPSGTVFADGKVVRLVPQLGYLAGPLSLYAEYIRLIEELNKGGVRNTLKHQSYHAVAALVLTGEKAVQLDIVSPKRPFDLAAGQFGALELTARVERVDFDKHTFPTFANPVRSALHATAIGGGFNWIPTEIIRVMLNYERTLFGAAPGAAKLKHEDLVGFRVQALF
ncbi:MAG: oprP [Myxococcaceae bacterium]|nr:oprP [Myxococcaceae bacterium]